MKIDVVMLTKNSGYILERCLDSVYRNIPINHLIVIDGFSTDKTLSILQKYNRKFHNIVIVQDAGTRATARQKGIGLVNTEWFAFVDSDVILREGWFETIRGFIRDDVGAIEGEQHPITSSSIPSKFPKEHVQISEVIKNLSFKLKKRNYKPPRGFTGDTLIRTSIVKKIRIPPILHMREDHFIMLHILRKGYKWISLNQEICDHYSISDGTPVALEMGAYTRVSGEITFKNCLSNLIPVILTVIYVAIKVKNSRVIPYAIKYYWRYLVGWLRWKEITKFSCVH